MKYANLEWRDGQPYSPEFDDVYFSADNGIEETEYVFILHNQLVPRFKANTQAHFVIAETGFGSGLNFLIAVKHWLELSQTDQTLHFYSVESTPFTPDDLIQAQNSWPALKNIAQVFQQQYRAASYGFHYFDLFDGRVKLVLMIGDVETMLPQMHANVDAWFLDGFAPGRNPAMWSDSVFSQIKRLSVQGTTFSTYTAAGFVRRGLNDIGFAAKKVSGTGNKRHMLAGEFTEEQFTEFKSPQPWFEYLAEQKIDKTITIIGAGIAGITTAWALVKRGYQVNIIEAGSEAGAQASGNPQGMLMPRLSLQDSADAEFYTSAYFYALRCLQQIDVQQGVWKQTGGMQLASSERIKKQIALYPQDASLAQVLDAKAASELSGMKISAPVHYYPLAACVTPQKILKRLIDKMGKALSITYNTQVASLRYINQQWRLVNQQNTVISETSCLVLANAWQLTKFTELSHVPLQPARGQLSYYKANAQSTQLTMPLSFDGYLMPEHNLQHVSGASFELDDSATDLRDDEFQSNFQDVDGWFSGLFNKDDICGGRASVRAVTPDRLPVVGVVIDQQQAAKDYAALHKGKPAERYPQAKNLPGLYINSGHGARGFTSAFLSSELLAAMICDEALPVSNRVRYALHSSRFLIRSFKKRKV